jgi:hypothetical protein
MLRKTGPDTLNNENQLQDWFSSTLVAAKFSNLIMKGKFPGYIQELKAHPFLNIINYSDMQFRCLKLTDHENRCLYINTLSNMVNIPRSTCINQNHAEYTNRILNYQLEMKNFKTNRKFFLSELITNSHDSLNLGKFFDEIRYKYEEIYGENDFNFRLIVVEYSWPLILSILNKLNNLETIIQYAQKCYELAKGCSLDSGLIIASKTNSWLVTCAHSTMQRFIKSIDNLTTGVKILTQSQKRYICFCFGLLLNSKSLDEISIYFKYMCIVFLSMNADSKFKEAELFLVNSLRERNNDYNSIQSLIDQMSINESSVTRNSFYSDSNEQSNLIESDQLSNSDRQLLNTLKSHSPFMLHFKKIKEEIESIFIQNNQVNNNDLLHCPNDNYLPHIVDHFIEKFLPYSFLWSGFMFVNSSNVNSGFSRIAHGSLSSSNAARLLYTKSSARNNLQPHLYVYDQIESVKEACQEYLNQFMTQNTNLNGSMNNNSNQHAKRTRCTQNTF